MERWERNRWLGAQKGEIAAENGLGTAQGGTEMGGAIGCGCCWYYSVQTNNTNIMAWHNARMEARQENGWIGVAMAQHGVVVQKKRKQLFRPRGRKNAKTIFMRRIHPSIHPIVLPNA